MPFLTISKPCQEPIGPLGSRRHWTGYGHAWYCTNQVMTAGEAPIKQAVKWIDDQLVDRPEVDRVTLVDEAARRFDLSPLDTDFLFRHLAERAKRP